MLPIFVINLDGSDQRLANVSAQLAQYDLSFERISAVDGRIMSESQRLEHYSPSLNRAGYYKSLTPGEIGCYLSHRKAWQRIVDENLEAAIILEDDFLMPHGLNDVAQFVQSKQAFDYVKLSDHPGRPRKTKTLKKIGDSQLVVFDKVPARTCAQLVSREGARKLLQASESFGRPVDIDLQYWWEKDIRVMGIKPFVFTPAPDVKSDISAMQSRNDMQKHRIRRLKQQLSFKLNNAFRQP
ncbi:glycosyltransferase family 25 protein [Glaciecola siphonariae]|uniref:Glycosyltransferase family 25 protein n=1 Tax=Glaciecola siphonariae TaxID=521012 RepID=A0ABV9LX31_9ALTE